MTDQFPCDTSPLFSPNLLLEVGGHSYAVPRDRVRQVIEAKHVTAVMQPPDYRSGFVAFNGRTIAVVDLRLSFGVPGAVSDLTRFVVVELALPGWEHHLVALIADAIGSPDHRPNAPGMARSKRAETPVTLALLDIDDLFDESLIDCDLPSAGATAQSGYA